MKKIIISILLILSFLGLFSCSTKINFNDEFKKVKIEDNLKKIHLDFYDIDLYYKDNFLYRTSYGDLRKIEGNKIKGDIIGIGENENKMIEVIGLDDFKNSGFSIKDGQIIIDNGINKIIKYGNDFYLLLKQKVLLKFNFEDRNVLKVIKTNFVNLK